MKPITPPKPQRTLSAPVTPPPDLSNVYTLPTLSESINALYKDLLKTADQKTSADSTLDSTFTTYVKFLAIRHELTFCQSHKIKVYVTAYYTDNLECDEVFKIHSWGTYVNNYGQNVNGLDEILKDACTMPAPFKHLIDDITGEILW